MKHLLTLLIAIIWTSSIAQALTVETLDFSQGNFVPGASATSMGTINADPDGYLLIVNIINEYLWFGLAGVAAGVLIYAGFILMTAQGDKAKMKQANQALVGLAVGLAIAYFSYTIVRMVVNWF